VRYSEPAVYPAVSEYLTCGLAGYFSFCRSPKTPAAQGTRRIVSSASVYTVC
jgi:hypothetical protein